MFFDRIEAAPADPILGITDAFKKDTRADKINLGVGVYKNEKGDTPILKCVKKAEKVLLDEETTKSYLPITGLPAPAERNRHGMDLRSYLGQSLPDRQISGS